MDSILKHAMLQQMNANQESFLSNLILQFFKSIPNTMLANTSRGIDVTLYVHVIMA